MGDVAGTVGVRRKVCPNGAAGAGTWPVGRAPSRVGGTGAPTGLRAGGGSPPSVELFFRIPIMGGDPSGTWIDAAAGAEVREGSVVIGGDIVQGAIGRTDSSIEPAAAACLLASAT